MEPEKTEPRDAWIMAPSLGRSFSGINATMEALLGIMRKRIPIACWGTHLSDRMPKTGLWTWLRSRERKHWRIWHARRNNDMLVGLFLRYVLRQKLILVFTSAAQRHHTWLTRFCYKRMDAVVATTRKAASFLERPAEVSHHGVNVADYQPPENRGEIRKALGMQDRPTIGVFGRVRPQKGTGDLVEALVKVLPEYPEWQILFVGATTAQFVPFRKQMEELLEQHGLLNRVTFNGFIEDFSQLPLWYQAVDVVACVSRNEGFGVTCLEGMASGAPVLATEAGAWPDIISEGETGWIAEAANPSDLARALKLVFETPLDELQEMGLAAREAVLNHYSIEHESARLISLYERMFQQFGEQKRAA